MGYRKYARDYEIEYVERPGKKRCKAVRIYVGPYFRFSVSPERVSWLRRFYLLATLGAALMLLLPLCITCPFAQVWYILVPLVAAWIPMCYVAGAVWRLWTAKDRVNREHYELLHDRMNGASLFLMGFTAISTVGCIWQLSRAAAVGLDYLVCGCCVGALACAVAMFSRRKELEMEQIDS